MRGWSLGIGTVPRGNSFLKIGLRARPALDKLTLFLGAGAELGLGIPQKNKKI